MNRMDFFKPFLFLLTAIFLELISFILFIKTLEVTFIIPLVLSGMFGLIELLRLNKVGLFNKIMRQQIPKRIKLLEEGK